MSQSNFEEDEILGKAYDARLMRRLGVFIQPYWRRLALAMGLLFGAAFAELLPPYLVSTAIDGPIAAHNPAGMLPIFALYLGALTVAFACRYGQTYIMQSTGQQVMVDIRMRIFSHIQSMSLSFFDRNPVGRLITRLTNDVDALNEFLAQGLVSLLGDSARLVFIVITMLVLNWRLALINANLNEQITGILVTQLFNREERSRIRFDDLSRDYRAAQFRSLMAFAVFFPTVSFLSVAATVLLLNLGGQVVLGGLATLGMLIAFFQYTDQTFGPIRQIAENYNTLQSAMASSERIFRILDTPADVAEPAQPRELAQPVRGEIELKDVWFSYAATKDERASVVRGSLSVANGTEPQATDDGQRTTDDWVLRGISLKIPAGQSVAVVGATGAGKTSLISLLARFYDIQSGAIT